MTIDSCTSRSITQFKDEYAYLSNFYQVTVSIDGIGYPSGEHAFHAQKTEDPAIRHRIADAATPGEAKRIGRSVPLIDGWDEWRRYDAMELVIEAKFFPGRDLTEWLCSTGDAMLVEGTTWHDRTWGICSCIRCAGNGHNLLGWMLMRRRALMQCKGRP